MKKTVFCLFGCTVLLLTVMIYDYRTNNRFSTATLYTVESAAYQETITFSAPIQKQGNLYLMSGAVKKIEGLTAGASSRISLGDTSYWGYLWRLTPLSDGIYYATVSVTGLHQIPKEHATAVIFGELRDDFISVPKECLITDKNGQDAVYVVKDGYAMLRKVETGAQFAGGKRQIRQGIFPSEILIVSPRNIRTGDRIFPR